VRPSRPPRPSRPLRPSRQPRHPPGAQATQDVISRLPETTPAEFAAAVAAAKAAFPRWRDTPVSVRARAMFKLQELIITHKDELALSVTMEQGKTIADAHGDVFRGLGAPPAGSEGGGQAAPKCCTLLLCHTAGAQALALPLPQRWWRLHAASRR
jgi:hypothetical protein